jgi:hypothetical protein
MIEMYLRVVLIGIIVDCKIGDEWSKISSVSQQELQNNMVHLPVDVGIDGVVEVKILVETNTVLLNTVSLSKIIKWVLNSTLSSMRKRDTHGCCSSKSSYFEQSMTSKLKYH